MSKQRSGGLAGTMTLLMLGLVALAGCRPAETGEVRALVIGDRLPKLSDPAAGALGQGDLILLENVAQGLVRFDSSGNIAPGLAQRWAVSDDGLSYVFRLRSAQWSDGRTVRARDVVRLLQRHFAAAGRNPLKDTVGAVREVVAMTDRVVAIELSAPRPHLLQLLAQPEFGLVRNGEGTGPFAFAAEGVDLLLTRSLPGFEDEKATRERVRLGSAPAGAAVAAFVAGEAELVLGGTAADLGVALGARLPRGALRTDPVAGLFGLVPARRDGPAADPEIRALLDQALDRQALVGALGVPQLQPRTSLLQPRLDGIAAPMQPDWTILPLAARRPALVERARELFPVTGDARPAIRVALPDGPGGAIILRRLQADWGALGIDVILAERGSRADFRWIDAVAPSTSPAWFLRNFRCGVAAICSEEADRLLDAARLTGFTPQRNAFFAQAEAQMREAVLFIPVAAPVRWSLVGRSVSGFTENRFARHPLTDLRESSDAQD